MKVITEKQAIHEIAMACYEVFELTGRSVPSNHQAKINALAARMLAIAGQYAKVDNQEEVVNDEQST